MQSLAARLAEGDEAAFAELYDQCADRLYRFLVVRLGSPENAADVLQEVFLRAVKSRRQFRKVENPIAYLFQMARNESLRQRKPIWRTCSADQLADVADNALAGADDSEAVGAALGRLAPDDRELIELKIYGNLTFGEIAEIVKRPLATVATQYRRALESLRGWLAKQYL
jgi:RNA polymerase sigma-70 factor (ECF subfamily)